MSCSGYAAEMVVSNFAQPSGISGWLGIVQYVRGKTAMKLDVTPAQLENMKRLVDDVDAMIGGGDAAGDLLWARYVKSFDRLLKRNGLPPREMADKSLD